MAQSDFDDDEPLDPVLERVQRRLRRLMLVGGLTLALGLAAVFAAMVYRIAILDDKSDSAAETGQPLAEVALPQGARLVSSALDGNRMLLVYEHAGGTLALVVDIASGEVVGEAALAGP